ncbi:MAG: mechanosensitive ion channel [Chloroflexota bacterium]
MINDTILPLLTADFWWSQLVRIGLFFIAAYLVHTLRWRIAGRLVRLNSLTKRGRQLREERRRTIRSLFASIITFVVFTVAVLFSLSLFIDGATLVWMVGLFSAAFGLGARPLISDFLTGVSFLLEDQFDVGDKVEILEVVGVVEQVNLRTMWLRAPTGELYIVPNGEVRVVRNFSRGHFSNASVTLKLATGDLNRAIAILEELGHEAIHLLPTLLEPWHVISETGTMGQQTELTLLAKAKYGQAGDMRPRLLALVQQRLAEAGIELAA